MFRQLDATFSVAPQIDAATVTTARELGFAMIVNNRPDGEEPDAPQGADIAAAAHMLGMGYVAIPVSHAGFSAAQLDALDAAMAAAGGPILAYCRSGTRSTWLWALTRARAGDAIEDIRRSASDAGYDVSNLVPMMEALRGER